MSDVTKRLEYAVDLGKPIKKTYIDTLFATEDNEAHRFEIALMRSGAAVSLPSGAAVTAYFIRYSDNATIILTGNTISGNVASITLKKACYNKAGQYAIIIKIVTDGVTSTVFYGEGAIFASITDTILDPENVIPSLSDLLAQIAVMEAATEDAKSATDSANTAADKADAAATSANRAAETANAKAQRAETAAEGAEGWANATATATWLVAGAAPTVQVITDEDGHKELAFGIPKGDKGDTGATPDITFDAATGAAGSEVQIEQSGTAEKPVVKLTIPKGEDGTMNFEDLTEEQKESLRGPQGEQGQTGADGYTPVKGTDYFTDAEISSIVSTAKTVGGSEGAIVSVDINGQIVAYSRTVASLGTGATYSLSGGTLTITTV